MKFIFVFIGALCILLAGCAAPAEPEAPGAIGQATADWYADPAGKLFVEPEVVEISSDGSQQIQITVANQDYIYGVGYMWDGNQWNAITYDGMNEVVPGWYSTSASHLATLDLVSYPEGAYFVAAYGCNLVNNAFDCNGGKWMLKEFVVEETIAPPPACPLNYDPVCGVDEVTYGNACQADVAGVAVDYEGECTSDTPSQRITDFVEKPTEYVIGSSKDLVIEIGDDHPNIDAAVFQVYHLDDADVQADIYDDSAPFIYPGSVLDTTNAGKGSVQVFLKENGNSVKVIKFTVNFVAGDGPICGNGAVESGEVCDGDSQTCTLNGQTGTQGCNSACSGYSSCQVQQVGTGDTLIPGSGWSGATPVGGAVGSSSAVGYDKQPIARWDVVPYQTFDSTFEVGLLAFHVNGDGYNGEGIDYVDFAVDGGDWVRVEQASLNPRTNVKEWWTTLDASKFSRDKQVELRAKIYPVHGQVRVISFNELYSNTGGTYDRQVIELEPGDHGFDSSNLRLFDSGYVVIKGKTGNREDVRVQFHNKMPAGNIKLQDLTVLHTGRTHLIATDQDIHIWFDNVHAHGPLDSTKQGYTKEYIIFKGNGYASNSLFEKIRTPFFQQGRLYRNTVIQNYFEDGIRRPQLVVNSVLDMDKSGSVGHPDTFEISVGKTGQSTNHDLIIHNVEVRNFRVQSVSGGNIYGGAFVNVSHQGPGPGDFNSLRIGGHLENILIKDFFDIQATANMNPYVADVVVVDNGHFVGYDRANNLWRDNCITMGGNAYKTGEFVYKDIPRNFYDGIVYRNGGTCQNNG